MKIFEKYWIEDNYRVLYALDTIVKYLMHFISHNKLFSYLKHRNDYKNTEGNAIDRFKLSNSHEWNQKVYQSIIESNAYSPQKIN